MSRAKDYKFTFGKFSKGQYAGKTLDELPVLELDGYRGYLEGQDDLSPMAQKVLVVLAEYLDDPLIQSELREAMGDDDDD